MATSPLPRDSADGLAPEIRCKIAQELANDRPTLYSLSLVCKDWTSAARSALYNNVVIGPDSGIPTVAVLWDLLCPSDEVHSIPSGRGSYEIVSCIRSLKIPAYGWNRAGKRFWREIMKTMVWAQALVSLTLNGMDRSMLSYLVSLSDDGGMPNSIQELHLHATTACGGDVLTFFHLFPNLSDASVSFHPQYRSIRRVGMENENGCSVTSQAAKGYSFAKLQKVAVSIDILHQDPNSHLASCASLLSLPQSLCASVPSVKLTGEAARLAFKISDGNIPAGAGPCVTELSISINELLAMEIDHDLAYLVNVRELRLIGCMPMDLAVGGWYIPSTVQHDRFERLFALLENFKNLTFLETFSMAFHIAMPPRTTEELDQFDWSRLCAALDRLPHTTAHDSINMLIKISSGTITDHHHAQPWAPGGAQPAPAEKALFSPRQLVQELRARLAPLEGRLRLLIPSFKLPVMCEAQYLEEGDDQNAALNGLDHASSAGQAVMPPLPGMHPPWAMLPPPAPFPPLPPQLPVHNDV